MTKKKQNKTVPGYKRKPCRDNTQKKYRICVCNSEMCAIRTHSPETKKKQK